MVALKFAETHNLVAFLEKPKESDGFAQIVDFLNAHPINYALTVNLTIYTSCIEQFLATAKAKTINGEKKQPRRNQRKDTKVPQLSSSTKPITDEAANEEHVPTHSNDPFLSGEDRLKLNELMELCTNLSQRVLNLETAKTAQAMEIASLKKKVKQLRKVGSARRVESYDEVILGAQEDASEQGRKITNLDVDAEVTLVDETQERNDDNLMFDTGVLDEHEVEVEMVVSIAEVTTASSTTTTVDELTLAQTLIEIKAAKPKLFNLCYINSTAVKDPRARGL
ncbi:hypothetical protein Tco_1438104 [Tanacetum coccineum]